jgi:hypothetical protein
VRRMVHVAKKPWKSAITSIVKKILRRIKRTGGDVVAAAFDELDCRSGSGVQRDPAAS